MTCPHQGGRVKRNGRHAAQILGGLLLGGLILSGATANAALPNPVLYPTGTERYMAGGKSWVRHKFDVLNKDQYPAAMFAPAPGLPPCGTNSNSSRSWVDIFDKSNRRLNGFCALGSPDKLGSIWFAVEEGVTPPSWVYIEINDRQTNTRYKSEVAGTTE